VGAVGDASRLPYVLTGKSLNALGGWVVAVRGITRD